MRAHEENSLKVAHLIANTGLVLGLVTGWLAGLTTNAAIALDATAAIETNRPSFMASPLVVPRGSLQLENGTLFSGLRHGQWTYDAPETEVRIGALKNTEIQMFVPNFFLLRNNNSTYGRASNLSEIGIKQHIPVAPKLDLAVIAAVSAPTGSAQINGPGTIPAVRVPYIYALNGKWGLGGMQSVLIRDQWRNVEWQPDVLLCRSIGSRSGAFIEYGGSFAQNHNPINLIHFGGAYKISHCQQLDCQFGFGLNESSPSAFVGAGYSVRFDQLHW